VAFPGWERPFASAWSLVATLRRDGVREEETMVFAVGDKVVHPNIGAGTVTGTKEQELIAGFKHYYIIDIPAWESTVYVPVRKADELGLRSVLSR
jgi:RNA polymerase-interacting CarD/CdnL/TRCF family regulator